MRKNHLIEVIYLCADEYNEKSHAGAEFRSCDSTNMESFFAKTR